MLKCSCFLLLGVVLDNGVGCVCVWALSGQRVVSRDVARVACNVELNVEWVLFVRSLGVSPPPYQVVVVEEPFVSASKEEMYIEKAKTIRSTLSLFPVVVARTQIRSAAKETGRVGLCR